MYGSSFIIVTRRPRVSRIAASEAAAMPLPSEDTTPPVTKTRGVTGLGDVMGSRHPLESPILQGRALVRLPAGACAACGRGARAGAVPARSQDPRRRAPILAHPGGAPHPARLAVQPLRSLSMNSRYNAADIEVLSGLDPVKRRPGMYTDTTRPNHLAQEVVDNAVDEALAGHAREISVILFRDGS